MSIDLDTLLVKYNYTYPDELIANTPASPRESARLLIYNRKADTITHDTFQNLANHLPKNTVLVFNQTKVLPARLQATKPTGGKTNLLYIKHDSNTIEALSDHKLTIGSKLTIDNIRNLEVISHPGKTYLLKANFPHEKIYELLNEQGTTPIPPYIKNSPLSETDLRQEYQTVFAKHQGSVAAPTASLHFSEALIEDLKKSGIQIEYLTLHVGLGTFAPLTEEHLKTGKLHEEYYEIDPETAARLNQAKSENKTIIPVGTTACRTLESAANDKQQITKLSGTTDLFIQETYQFKFASGIITNFHVPKSSLLMLVSAFTTRDKLMHIYQQAIQKKYRLFSFGDGMLIL